MLLRFMAFICVIQLAVQLCAQGVSSGPWGTKLNGFGNVDGAGTVEFWAEHERQNTSDEFDLHTQSIENDRGSTQNICGLGKPVAVAPKQPMRGSPTELRQSLAFLLG